jgi:hypothetical protein
MVASGTEAQRWTNVWSCVTTRLSIASTTDDGVNALQIYGPASATSLKLGPVTATTTAYVLNASGNAYISGSVDCESVIDHSNAPDTLTDAYAIVDSHESLNGRIDHSKLSPLAWGTKHTKHATGRTLTREVQVEEAIPLKEVEPVEDDKEPVTTRVVTKTIEEPEYETLSEPDSKSRNLSMVISAQALVIQDLEKRLEALEAK